MERQHTVLLVDDEPNVISALLRIFRREDYEFLTAGSGREALELMPAREISLIISDQQMPGMSGTDFLHRARELSPHTVRILLTGQADMATALKAINEGEIYRFVAKPWEEMQLRMTVHEAVDRFELEARNRALTLELEKTNADLEALNADLGRKVDEQTRELLAEYGENIEWACKLRQTCEDHQALVRSLQDRIAELEAQDSS